MFKNLTSEGWKSNFQIFQIVMQIIEIMKNPEDSENYFQSNAKNEELLTMYKTDKEKYKQTVTKEQEYVMVWIRPFSIWFKST